MTFDAPDRLHYLARRSQKLFYVRDYLLPATSPATFTYFENGFMTVSRRLQREIEQQAVSGGHMPWRNDHLWLAQVMSMPLLPAIPVGKIPIIRETPHGATHDVRVASGNWEAVFRQVSVSRTQAKVDVWVNGQRWYRLKLDRPFGKWWYVTAITTLS